MSRLREEAQRKLGARFDDRAFYRQVLQSANLPLGMFRDEMEQWIARQP